MAQLPISQGVPRFKENEEKFNVFVNAPNGEETYETSAGEHVTTLPFFKATIETDLTDVENRLTLVEAVNAVQSGQITVLQTEISDIDVSGLTTRVGVLESEMNTVEGQVGVLQNTVVDLQDQIDNIDVGHADEADKLSTPRNIGLSGDVVGTPASFDGTNDITIPVELSNTGVTAGTYPKVTVDSKGRVTSGDVLVASDVPAIAISGVTGLQPALDAKVNNSQISSSVNSTSSTDVASSSAVKAAYDAAIAAAGASVPLSQKGVPNGVASLGNDGMVPASQLPSYVDDVLEFPTLSAFPATGEAGKIYIDTSTNLPYRWTGTQYVNIGDAGGGVADEAVKLVTPRTIALSGGVTGTPTGFDGSSNITIPVTALNADLLSSGTVPSARLSGSYAIESATAQKWTTARTVSFTSDVTGSVSLDGSANVSSPLTLSNSGVTAGTYTKVTVDSKGRVTSGASVGASDIPTLNQNTTGSAATLTTARTIALTGADVTGTATSFNGSANISIPTTLSDTGVTAGAYGIGVMVDVLSTPVSGAGLDIARSGEYIASTGDFAPYYYLGKITPTGVTDIPLPALGLKSPGNVSWGTSQYVAYAVSASGSSSAVVFKRTGDTVANIAELETGSCRALRFDRTGVYLTIVRGSAPNVVVYKRTGDTFTKLTDPDNTPSAVDVVWSNSGVYMAVLSSVAPFISIYKRTGDTFIKLAGVDTPPTSSYNYSGGNARNKVIFSQDDTHLLVAQGTAPYLNAYKRVDDSFSKLPDTPYSSVGVPLKCIAFSPNNEDLYVTKSTGSQPFMMRYKKIGDSYSYSPIGYGAFLTPTPGALAFNDTGMTFYWNDNNNLKQTNITNSCPTYTVNSKGRITYSTSSPFPQTITGNAGTATKLLVPRTINGIPFDGSSDITIPTGVATSADRWTTPRTLTAIGHIQGSVTFDGSSNEDFYMTLYPTGVTSGTYGHSGASTATTFNIPYISVTADGRITSAENRPIVLPTVTNITGNAGTANRLVTPRSINSVPFDGSADITVLGNQGAENASTATHYVSFSTSNSAGNIQRKVSDKITFQPSTGNLTATGDISGLSDERLKRDWVDLSVSVEDIASIKSGKYTRIDTGAVQVGVAAQSLQSIIPEAVNDAGDGYLSVAYGNAALALLVELAKEIVVLKEEISLLKGE